jgi:hypothetical protein
MTRRISIVFSAGALGGLLNALLFWLFGMVGITALVGMTAPVKWDPPHIYWGVTWGGIWGAMFLLPWLKGSVVLRGLLFSIAPTLVAWLIVFPLRGMGPLGLKVGALMPFLAIVLNAVWGIGAALWVREAEIHGESRGVRG